MKASRAARIASLVRREKVPEDGGKGAALEKGKFIKADVLAVP
jgi:hypothetical protein